METLTTPMTSLNGNDLLQAASKLGSVLNQSITEEEHNGRLSTSVVSALRQAGFYKLFLPESLGGLEAEPLTVAKVVEEVASHNTAAGWSLMVANTTLLMLSRIPQKGIDEIFGSDPDAFIAGTVHPPMMATRVEGGYLINGRNPLVSNVHEAKWLMVLSLVIENGHPKMVDGHPEILGVYMKADDCKIIDTWQVIGMHATDSNDIEAKDVFVPDHRVCSLMAEFKPGKHFTKPLYHFPAAGANIACLLAPVSLAVASNAINELKAIASKKTPLGSMVTIRDRGVIQRKLGMAEAMVRSGRVYLHDAIEKCWQKTSAGESVSLEEKAGLALAAAHTNQSCVQAVELMYTAAGSTGIYKRSKMAHYLSDAQVLRQHGFMNESRYETAAQVFLGLRPDLPIIAL
ncbi:MAG TPA: acyl-CoA dehydrogenase family protein [Chitinophagaceae bacterium]|nr:acyl-CoA dehydrogenase family protein [Chitinophagaceae bacterium]